MIMKATGTAAISRRLISSSRRRAAEAGVAVVLVMQSAHANGFSLVSFWGTVLVSPRHDQHKGGTV